MLKLISKLAVLSAIALLTPGLAYAQWYVGAGAGQTNIETETTDTSDSSVPATLVIDDNSTYAKIFVGWRATPSFALELGYANLGKYTFDINAPGITVNETLKARALSLEGVGSISLGGNWRFLGKLGLANWDGKIDYSDNTPFSDSGDGKGVVPVLGLGFEYRIKLAKTQLGVRLEWEQYQNIWEDVSVKTDSTTTDTYNGLDINTFGLAVTYDFPM